MHPIFTMHVEWAQRPFAGSINSINIVSVMLLTLLGDAKDLWSPHKACEMPIWTLGGILVPFPGLCSVSGTGEGVLLAGTV